jgi:3',5'-cyclic-AMP phosphodiesterase
VHIRKTIKLLFMSDTHVHSLNDANCPACANEHVNSLVTYINTYHHDAAACVFLGDLTETGSRMEFSIMRQSLARLRVPYRLLIGNHDNRAHFLEVFPEQECDGDGFVQTVMAFSPWRIVGLDTSEPGTAVGWYCPRRLEWLERQLRGAGGDRVVLCAHHPLCDIFVDQLDLGKLQPAGKIGDLVDRYKDQIEQILFGHVHCITAGSWLGIPTASIPSASPRCRACGDAEFPTNLSAECRFIGVLYLSRERVALNLEPTAELL